MKLAIDIQGLQSKDNIQRGIGRYTLCLIREIIRQSFFHEIILVANSNLRDVQYLFENEINDDDLNLYYLIHYFPERESFGNLSENDFNKLAINFRSYTYSLLNVDLILISSFFEGFNNESIIQLDENTYNLPPISSIIYDLIPLLHSNLYLDSNPNYKKFYLTRLEQIKKLDYIFTISDSALNEISSNLEFDVNRIKNISSACDKNLFFPSDSNKDFFNKSFLKEKKYILYSGAADPRKNLKTLIIAYSKLDDSLKNDYSLVIVGGLIDDEKNQIFSILKEHNVDERFVELKGYVSDNLLVKYYQNCSLFVFPSIHEGFGLPVLEAISCGAPVIASSLTSIPEILTNKDALFDPYDVDALSLKIQNILCDTSLRDNLVSTGLVSARAFSWEKTANHFVDYCCKTIFKQSLENTTNFTLNRESMTDGLLEKVVTCSDKESQQSYLKSLSVCLTLNHKNIDLLLKNRNASYLTNEWLIEGPYDSSYSLSILNQFFALSLSKLGQKVILNSSEGPGDFKPDIDYLRKNLEIYNLHKDSLYQLHNGSINSRNMYPPRVKDMNSNFNHIHAFGWEETEMPLQYVIDFNTYLNGITVMSSQVKQILINNGVSVPISICGLGADHLNNLQKADNFLLEKKGFTFLHISSCFPRKGINLLLEAYGMSFTNKDDVTLIIKTFPNPHNKVVDFLEKLQINNPLYPHVILINEDLEKNQILSLYDQSDALVAPSYGEGFGLPMAEAMYFDLPVITTNWGGQTDFCSVNNSWLIDFDFEYSNSHFGLFSSVWAKPSKDHLSRLMNEIVNSTQAEISIKTNRAKSDISNYFTWENVAKKNIQSIQSNSLSKFLKYFKIGWISSWNTKCGIASYSEHLIENFISNVDIFAPTSSEIIYEDEQYVNRCWDMNSPNLDNLYQEIIHSHITNLVIQFNYGFFDFRQFESFIRKIKNKNISIVMFLHSTNDPPLAQDKRLSSLSPVLKLVDKLLVHTPKDMNRLKEIGLINNVSLFPHGIIENKISKLSKNNSNKSCKVLATFGFCLPKKGFYELIHSVVRLNEQGYSFKLVMYTSIYNKNYLSYYDKLITLINSLNASSFIRIDSEYKNDQVILEELSASDLIVLPYQSSGESSSAAVRQAIASNVPVAVTPLPIFDDVSPVVYKLSGLSINSITKGIIDFFYNPNSKAKVKIEKNLPLWIEQHSFLNLGYRLEEMIKSISINRHNH